jgi:chromosome partitioning protein
MIILFGGEKGGTGKTTLATNISAMLSAKGSDVLLIDTDKQGSASSWAAIRETDSGMRSIPAIQKFGNAVLSAVKDLSKRYDDLIIDAGGRDSIELRAALTVADKAYIPLQASQFDVWTLGAMDKLVEQVKTFNPNLEAYVIINRASPNPSVTETKETLQIFEDLENLKLTSIIIRDRIAYRKAARSGLSVTEMNPVDPKANDEVLSFFEEIYDEHKTKAA